MNKTIYVCRRELVLNDAKQLGFDLSGCDWPDITDGQEVQFDNPTDRTGKVEGLPYLIERDWCEEVEAGRRELEQT